MMSILVPIAAVTIIGLICAVGLSVASALLAVKEDERFPAIRECLPGANCGACGYSGCDGYAKALLKPGTKTNLCVPGADTVALRAIDGSSFQVVSQPIPVTVPGAGSPMTTAPTGWSPRSPRLPGS